MGHKNYSKFSQHFKNTENNPANTIEENKTEVLEGQVSVNDITGEQNDNVIEPVVETVLGFVSGCEKLNMRKEPNKESDVLIILNKNTEVQVNMTESTTEDFYKVYGPNGVEGYCMKQFISIK